MRTAVAVLVALVVGAFAVWAFDINVTGETELPNVDANIDADPGALPEYEVEQTQEGRLPSVDGDVDVSGGNVPDVDVEGPDVEVGEETVTVPDVDVDVSEKPVDVPTIDVEPAGEGG